MSMPGPYQGDPGGPSVEPGRRLETRSWSCLPESVLVALGRWMPRDALSAARLVCREWRQSFSLVVQRASVDIRELTAEEGAAYLHEYLNAFQCVSELELVVSFRRLPRERIQASLDSHVILIKELPVQKLQITYDLNSFNERKVKLPDLSLLAQWSRLEHLVVQESGWRSQQLRVDAPKLFGALPQLQTLTITCSHSGIIKAAWERAGGPNSQQLAANMRGLALSQQLNISNFKSLPKASQQQSLSLQQMANLTPQQLIALTVGRAPTDLMPVTSPCVTRHLRCQISQNQSIGEQLQKSIACIDTDAVKAVTFEIIEETYAEPQVAPGPVDLSKLPSLASFTLLNGAEDALCNSQLELLGAGALKELVLYDISTGRWCYTKPGHGVPTRLFTSPSLCSLTSLVLAGFVLAQTSNLTALASLTTLQSLRLEQPETDSLAAVSGELPLAMLPTSLTSLRLRSLTVPVPALPSSYASTSSSSSFAPAGASGLAPIAGLPSLLTSGASLAHPSLSLPPHQRQPHPAAPRTALDHTSSMDVDASAAGAAGTKDDDGDAEAFSGSKCGSLSPLPRLRELHLSRCKVPSFGAFGACPDLRRLGIINCLSGPAGLEGVAAAMPMIAELAVIYTLTPEAELGPSLGQMMSAPGGGAAYGHHMAAAAGGSMWHPLHLPHHHHHAALAAHGLPTVPGAPAAASPGPGGLGPGGLAGAGRGGRLAAGPAAAGLAAPGGLTMSAAGMMGSMGMLGPVGPVGSGPAAAAVAAVGGARGGMVPGLPLCSHWGCDAQLSLICQFQYLRQLQLVVPRGTAACACTAAGVRALVDALACSRVLELDLALPCGLSDRLLALVKLQQLTRLTLWVDGKTLADQSKARQLQGLKRNLHTHMPGAGVEWAVADSRAPSWTGLEAQVFKLY